MTDLHVRTEKERSEPEPGVPPEAARTLMKAAFMPTGITVGLLVVVVLVVLLTGDGDFTGVFAAVGAGWLGIHQVTLPISGVKLGVLPLVVTAAIFAASYSQCRKVARDGLEPRDAAQLVAAVVGVPLVMTIISLAVVKDASTVLKVATPNVLQSFLWTVVIHGLAAVFALGKPFWSPIAERARIPVWGWGALAAAKSGAVALGATGLAVTMVLLAGSLDEIIAMLEEHHGAAAPLGLTLVSLLYLANVVVGVIGVTTGASITVGEGHYGLFDVLPAPAPGVPVLAALPTTEAADWWPILLVVPVIGGVALARSAYRQDHGMRETFFVGGTAAVVVSVGYLIAATAAGGALGVFGTVSFAPLYGALFLCAWLVLSGGAALGLLVWRKNRHERHERRADVEQAIAEALAEEESRKAAAAEKARDLEDSSDSNEPSGERSGLLKLVRNRVPSLPISVKSLPGAVSTLPGKVRHARQSLPGVKKQQEDTEDTGGSAEEAAEVETTEVVEPAESSDTEETAHSDGEGAHEQEEPEGQDAEGESPGEHRKQSKWKIWQRNKRD
ncbi:cell division protein PerM [Hoyosella subflava]|uniref:Hypothetical membrane protein n=1 Tax=Hoyosella subflava (strain DSM 45089 / JCM 17490 / NBRC 109087 / DQS3-9A1) TaxID=443218 RepID=F6ERE1_HOYSD|nr:DUF6350 family protein [Hoyosella subflava]AEF42019.1 Hypothetical membrane protein [Hoyosella subflava DQS3-9A1]